MSGLSPGFLSKFDEPTLSGITEDFIASTDWRPVDQTIRMDISVDIREYAARIKTPTLLITAKHDQIVPPAYSENLVPYAKTLELTSGHLIFWKSQSSWLPQYSHSANRKQASPLEITPRALGIIPRNRTKRFLPSSAKLMEWRGAGSDSIRARTLT